MSHLRRSHLPPTMFRFKRESQEIVPAPTPRRNQSATPAPFGSAWRIIRDRSIRQKCLFSLFGGQTRDSGTPPRFFGHRHPQVCHSDSYAHTSCRSLRTEATRHLEKSCNRPAILSFPSRANASLILHNIVGEWGPIQIRIILVTSL